MKKIALILILFVSSTVSFSQKFGNNKGTLNTSAALEVQSTTKGFLPPRMTQAQMIAIVDAVEGLMVYCTDCNPKGVYFYNNGWVSASSTSGLPIPSVADLAITGNQSNGFVGTILTGTYTYKVNGSTGTESGTVQKWYTASNATDAGTLVATGATYTPTSADLGKYIIYEVTPSSSSGAIGESLRTSRYAGTQILDFTSQTVQAAYSLRKLKSSYTGNAVQVRRSSDNTTQDFGFTASGLLDETAIINFVTYNGENPTSNGFVSIWYDQSGNSRNVTNTTLSQQPTIVTAGIIERYNGLPTVKFVRTSSSKLQISVDTGFDVTSAMAVYAYTAANTYNSWDGVVSDFANSNGNNSIAIQGTMNFPTTGISTNLFGFSGARSGAVFYKNKVATANSSYINMSPISDLNAVYTENSTTLGNLTKWYGVLLGSDRNFSDRRWGGPISEVLLFVNRLNSNFYADVLKIQDAQMLYYQGK
jgi:hypothetical protein